MIKDLKNKILNVTIEELNLIDLSQYSEQSKNTGAPVHWFYLPAGREHYRLLAFISQQVQNKELVDIGTYQGSSAIALAFNQKNRVISFDLFKNSLIDLINIKNIQFKIDNVLSDIYTSILLNSPVIFLDTDHDGVFEQLLYDHLHNIGYEGILILDDIHLNSEMKFFWNSISKEKYDLTKKGHWSGTGIVIF
jgi:hypothetical protein